MDRHFEGYALFEFAWLKPGNMLITFWSFSVGISLLCEQTISMKTYWQNGVQYFSCHRSFYTFDESYFPMNNQNFQFGLGSFQLNADPRIALVALNVSLDNIPYSTHHLCRHQVFRWTEKWQKQKSSRTSFWWGSNQLSTFCTFAEKISIRSITFVVLRHPWSSL